MNRDKLKTMILLCKGKLIRLENRNNRLNSFYAPEYSMYYSLISHTRYIIEDLEEYLNFVNHYQLTVDGSIGVLDYILDNIEFEENSEKKIAEGKIFQSAKEKVKEASFCFERGDYPSTINNLNTGLELLLKEKFDIPTTITKINTAKIIEIAVKHKLGPVDYLKQAKKHISIDNEIKHRGYVPTKSDCVKALKAMEELSNKLKGMKIDITEEIRDKIYSGI